MVKVREDLTGQKFGRLTVKYQTEDYVDSKGKHYACWLCECECKKQTIVRQSDLKLSDRIYKCDCGLTINRDYNAAINIKNEGLRILKTA